MTNMWMIEVEYDNYSKQYKQLLVDEFNYVPGRISFFNTYLLPPSRAKRVTSAWVLLFGKRIATVPDITGLKVKKLSSVNIIGMGINLHDCS